MFDVCKIEPQYQIYLCIQAAEHFYIDNELSLEGYTYEQCEEVLPNIFMFKCPHLFYVNKRITLEVEFKFYLSGSTKKATSILYYKFEDKSVNALALIEDINLEKLKNVEKTKRGIDLERIHSLVKD